MLDCCVVVFVLLGKRKGLRTKHITAVNMAVKTQNIYRICLVATDELANAPLQHSHHRALAIAA